MLLLLMACAGEDDPGTDDPPQDFVEDRADHYAVSGDETGHLRRLISPPGGTLDEEWTDSDGTTTTTWWTITDAGNGLYDIEYTSGFDGSGEALGEQWFWSSWSSQASRDDDTLDESAEVFEDGRIEVTRVVTVAEGTETFSLALTPISESEWAEATGN